MERMHTQRLKRYNNPRNLDYVLDRARLPYGVWICDGSEVLFNRDYEPLWERLADGTVRRLRGHEWIRWKDMFHFFRDDTAPWVHPATRPKLIEILQSWGVEPAPGVTRH